MRQKSAQAGTEVITAAERFIRHAIAKSCCATVGTDEESGRALVYSPIYANYHKLSGIAFALNGSPPRGIIFAVPYGGEVDLPDKWRIVNVIGKPRQIIDEQLETAITNFIKEKHIPLMEPSKIGQIRLRGI